MNQRTALPMLSRRLVKRVAAPFGLLVLFACTAVSAQTSAPSTSPPPPAKSLETPPPMPTAPAREAAPKADTTAKTDGAALSTPGRSEDNIGPQVTVRQDGDNKIEEFRQNGRVYAVRVTPPHGKPYTMVDNDGSGNFVQSAEIGGGPPRPARWLVFEF